jgi:Lar family restriction alleviation protein
MIELKKCPFCGGEAELVDCGKNEWFVRCKKGCVEGKLYRQKCDAKNAWNRRATQNEHKNPC